MKLSSLFASAVALVVCVTLVAACGSTQPPATCDATNCLGCCDRQGLCHPGTDTSFCGQQGAVCAPCSPGLSCVAGLCTFGAGGGTGTGGGAGGGTGGGGAVDGGADAGMGGGGGSLDAGTRCTDGCTGATPVCDTTTMTCVGCTSHFHCRGATPWCNTQLKTCGECNGNQGCGPARPLCDTRSGVARCVGCQSDSQCDPSAPICDPTARTCVTCNVGRGCSGTTPVCDVFVDGGACVECLADTHCPTHAPFCDLRTRKCVEDAIPTGDQVAAGSNYSCAVTSDAGVKCWGYNTYGQLGDGTTLSRYTAGDVMMLTGDVKEVAGGSAFACARTSTPRLACWGYNTYGQLGNGGTTASPVPVNVVGLQDATGIDCGLYHACALTPAGGVKCWGYNTYGQLGNGSTSTSYTPVDVQGLSQGVLSVRAAGYFSCAALVSGEVRCWGYNTYGQLGDGTTSTRGTPGPVAGLSGVTALALGTNHACALLSSGGVKCWGYNTYGQLGNGTTVNSPTPVDVQGLAGALALAAGTYHTCALLMGGTVKCWGYNYYGQLGDGTVTNSPLPVTVQGLAADALGLAAGDSHVCVKRQSGGVQCWGHNSYGQVGNGSTSLSVPGPSDVVGF
ncbi:MAG: hypothetical protein AB1938_24265 [Myxococcota bacterium]